MGKTMISVITSVYNHLAYLGESIESILGQTYGDFEFIVIDDASNEPVWDVVQDYARRDRRIRPIRNSRNLGLAQSLNLGLDLAEGDFIARQDADDRSHPQRFANQLPAFAPNVGLVTCWAVPIDTSGEVIGGACYERRCHVDSDEAARIVRGQQKNAVIEPSMMFSRAVFEKIGYHDVAVGWLESYNYVLRILQFFDFAVVQEVLYFRRRGTSTNERTTKEEFARLRAREAAIIKHH
jgi:glycosyltransferase involved in cell wall biosynthesis